MWPPVFYRAKYSLMRIVDALLLSTAFGALSGLGTYWLTESLLMLILPPSENASAFYSVLV